MHIKICISLKRDILYVIKISPKEKIYKYITNRRDGLTKQN